jgi:hypothetical protein
MVIVKNIVYEHNSILSTNAKNYSHFLTDDDTYDQVYQMIGDAI